MPSGIYKRTENQKRIIQKIGFLNKGKKNPYLRERNLKNNPAKKGNEHYCWKGDSVGYRSLHQWVEKQLGIPRLCEECGNRELRHRQYHWSNISGEYKRDLTDWRRLCVKCHMTLDRRAKTENY